MKITELPGHITSLPELRQKQWLAIYNGVEGESTATADKALAVANGVLLKELGTSSFTVPVGQIAETHEGVLARAKGAYQYVDSYEYEERKLAQTEAGYSPVGGTSTKACSSCRFFVSPARCTVVRGEIAPNGLSNQWQAVKPYVQEPLPVVIMGGALGEFKEVSSGFTPPATSAAPTSKGMFRDLLSKAVSAIRSAAGGAPPSTSPVLADPGPLEGLIITKQADGRLRWVSRYSNAWEDLDGEIIVEASHKEYLEWVESTKMYPELWLWHTAGTRFGEADWLDFADGFAFASGLIDDTPAAKSVVEYLGTQKNLGVSHGFLCLQKGKYVTKHRTFEISVLPLERAAVWTTNFDYVGKETQAMALTDARKKWLEDALGADKVAALEASTKSAVDALKVLGVEYKEVSDTPPVELPSDINEVLKMLVIGQANQQNQLGALATALVATKEAADKASTAVATTVENQVDNALVSKLEKALADAKAGNRPTESDTNLANKEAAAALGEPGAGDPVVDMLTKSGVFPAGMFSGAAAAAAGGGIGTPAAAGLTIK